MNRDTSSMTADDALRLDMQVCFPIYAAANALARLYRPVLDELGLTYPQYLVMMVLWEQDHRSVGELGRLLYLDSGTLTPLLKRLEAAGLVNRQRDPADERRVVISLTAEGRRLKTKARKVPLQFRCQLPLQDDELLQLRSRMRGLLTALNDDLA